MIRPSPAAGHQRAEVPTAGARAVPGGGRQGGKKYQRPEEEVNADLCAGLHTAEMERVTGYDPP